MKNCPSDETLVDLWAGELDEQAAEAVDEHLFGCKACAAETERLAGVVGALREKIPFVISHAHRERLVAAGMRVQVTEVDRSTPPVASATARFAANVDLLVFALRADVSDADRVDVELASPTGTPRYLVEDVPFDREAGEVGAVKISGHDKGTSLVHADVGDAAAGDEPPVVVSLLH